MTALGGGDEGRAPAEPSGRVQATPMMAQYAEIKGANPDCLVFYRLGDFYELFFGDAETASRALGLTLTKRGQHLGRDVPMCGVPVHAADDYLQRLLALGHRVAVAEQTETPEDARKRGGKAIVRRDVTRLVTPGTLTDEAMLEPASANHLLSLARVTREEAACFGLAWIDASTGDFRVGSCDANGLAAAIARVEPREIVLSDKLAEDDVVRPLLAGSAMAVTPLAAAFFDSSRAGERLTDAFGVHSPDAFGAFSRAELAAISGALAYLGRVQAGGTARLDRPRREASGEVVAIDAATRASLEITRTLAGERRGSLLWALDRTVTAAGSRLLAARLAAPLTCPREIAHRLDIVEALHDAPRLRGDLREILQRAPDLTRALSRVGLGRAAPRDLGAVRDGLAACSDLRARLEGEDEALGRLRTALDEVPAECLAALADALCDELPAMRREGGFVREGHDAALDEARRLSRDGRRMIAALGSRYAEETGIRSLKVKHNNVLGYFLEASASGAGPLMRPPLSERFIHRQTLASAVRFTTTEMSDLEARILGASEAAADVEARVFERLCGCILGSHDSIRACAHTLAKIDVAASLAELAEARDFRRPRIDTSTAFAIEGGRHPVVEAARLQESDAFVSNDCDLSGADDAAGRIWLVTGPNMAGKSTFLRQNALIALMAQAGSFVPAKRAHIGLVDRLFSRVGASDDLARGRSTFMVEMIETAAILHQATPRSLVVMDEIGRGTATYDGLSIAWSALEHLHEVNRARALFATHYHELTALAERLPRLDVRHMAVKEWRGEVVFLHAVEPGAAGRSYGVQVARLAGLPPAVVDRAREVLAALEKGERGKPGAAVDDLPLFATASARAPAPVAACDPVLSKIKATHPDELTPREALDMVYELVKLAREGGCRNG